MTMLFSPGDDSAMLRGPNRRVVGLYGSGSGILSRDFDITAGICSVSARTVNQSAFNAIGTETWIWKSYDRACLAMNIVDVSGGGLVSSGLGAGTVIRPVLNVSPLVCTAFVMDTQIPASS